MRRLAFLAGFLAAVAAGGPALAQAEQQATVDRATLTVNEILGGENGQDAITLLRRARAVMICPRMFRAGFIFGGEGGDCLLVARDGGGSWSSPAFYGIGTGSVGFQIGVQDSQAIMMILTQKGLDAMMDSQFKLGADAGLAAAHLGAGIGGATTAAVGADIVTFARARGLFAGISIEGSLMSYRSEWARAYYNRDVGPRQIVVGMEVHNPGSDPLRAALMRFGAPEPAAAPALPPPATPGAAAPSGAVRSEPLPSPPRR